MLNFIGSAPPLAEMAALDGVHVHLYGKLPKPLRKIGHATVTAADQRSLVPRLRKVQQLIERSGG
jgi:5-(carboxyamino)imidazole ribonucleotide synthase